MRKLFFLAGFASIANYSLAQWNTNGNNINNTNSGNVGIGIANPLARLHISGGQIIETSGISSNSRTLTLMQSGSSQLNLGYYSGAWRSAIQIQNNNATKALFMAPPETDYNYAIFRSVEGGIKFDVGGDIINAGANAITIDANTNVGIGTSDPQVKLAVNGDILSKKIKVTQTGWADYVFEKEYHLPSLAEVEAYINEHKHLPDVPSAKEVEKNGLDLGDGQALLLKKIEELTLYVIQQQSEIDAMKKEIKELKKQNTNKDR